MIQGRIERLELGPLLSILFAPFKSLLPTFCPACIFDLLPYLALFSFCNLRYFDGLFDVDLFQLVATVEAFGAPEERRS